MNNPLDTTFFDEAVKFALEAHHGTERRGKGYPYLIHLMEAATIVATITNDQEMLAAAILHDTVEDTDVTLEQIRERLKVRRSGGTTRPFGDCPHGFHDDMA